MFDTPHDKITHYLPASSVRTSVSDPDPELARLLAAEHSAFERHNRLINFSDEERAVTLALWTEAKDEVQSYRATPK
jgi:hypothetical protein